MSFTKEDSMRAKGIGILLLLFHHLFFNKARFGPYDVTPQFISENSLITIATAARVCVWIFVFISAYGITIQYLNRSESESIPCFTFKRWFSLMKNFWLVYVLVTLTLFAAGLPVDKYNGNPLYAILDFLGIADIFGTPTRSGAWWYMSFAQVMVVLMPFLIELCKKFSWSVIVLTFIGLQYLPDGFVSSSGGAYAMYLPGIILGILCAQHDLFRKLKEISGWPKKLIVSMALCLAAVCLICFRFWIVSDAFAYNNRYLHWILYSIAAVLLCALATQCRFKGILAFLGKHSGTMPLTHMFFVYYASNVVFYTKTVLGSYLTLIAFSLLSSIVIECVKSLIQYEKWLGVLYTKIIKLL